MYKSIVFILTLFSISFCGGISELWKHYQKNARRQEFVKVVDGRNHPVVSGIGDYIKNYAEEKYNYYADSFKLLFGKKKSNEEAVEDMKNILILAKKARLQVKELEERKITVKNPIPNADCIHGRVENGECICDKSYYGPICDSYCNDSNGHIVENTYCHCDASDYKGPSCSDHCAHGNIVNGKCVCSTNYQGSYCQIHCVHGSSKDDITCECDQDYKGSACDVRCVHGVLVNNVCVCDDDYTGPTCARARCPYGSKSNNVCVCNSVAYSRNWYDNISCDAIRPIRCRINLIGFESDCGYDMDDINNKVIYSDINCKTLSVDDRLNLKFGLECRLDSAAYSIDQPYGYSMTSTSSPSNIIVTSNIEGVVLDLDPKAQLDIAVNAINFSKRRGNKLNLFNLTAGKDYLNYTIDPTTNVITYNTIIDFVSEPLTKELIEPMFRSQFSDTPFTNRLFVEISGKVNIDSIPTEDLPSFPIIAVNSKWVYVDFPSMPLPPHVYPKLSVFTIVIIIIASVVFVLVVLYVIYVCYQSYKETRDEKREAVEREEERKKKLAQRENEREKEKEKRPNTSSSSRHNDKEVE